MPFQVEEKIKPFQAEPFQPDAPVAVLDEPPEVIKQQLPRAQFPGSTPAPYRPEVAQKEDRGSTGASLTGRAAKNFANRLILSDIEKARPSSGMVDSVVGMSKIMDNFQNLEDEGVIDPGMGFWQGLKAFPKMWWAVTKGYYAPESQAERSAAHDQLKKYRGAAEFDIPTPETVGEKVVDAATGLAAFVTRVAITKKILPASLNKYPNLQRAMSWELTNTEGLPGESAAMAGVMGSIGQIPAGTNLTKAGRLFLQSGALGGITAVKGGDKVDIAIASLIPFAFGALDAARGGISDTQMVKSWRQKLPFTRDIPMNTSIRYAKALRQMYRTKGQMEKVPGRSEKINIKEAARVRKNIIRNEKLTKQWEKQHGHAVDQFMVKANDAFRKAGGIGDQPFAEPIPQIPGTVAAEAGRPARDLQVTHRMPDGSIMQGPEHPGAVPGSTITEPTRAAVSKTPTAPTDIAPKAVEAKPEAVAVFHGTMHKDIGDIKTPFAVSRSAEAAKEFGDNVLPFTISPDANIATPENAPDIKIEGSVTVASNIDAIAKQAEDAGFDAIDIQAFVEQTGKQDTEQEIRIFNKDIISQPEAVVGLRPDQKQIGAAITEPKTKVDPVSKPVEGVIKKESAKLKTVPEKVAEPTITERIIEGPEPDTTDRDLLSERKVINDTPLKKRTPKQIERINAIEDELIARHADEFEDIDISPKTRNAEIKKVREQILADPVFQIQAEAAEALPDLSGSFNVDSQEIGDVKQRFEGRPELLNKFDLVERGGRRWDSAADELELGIDKLDDFMDMVELFVESKKPGAINPAALADALTDVQGTKQGTSLEIFALKEEMLTSGFTAAETNDAIIKHIKQEGLNPKDFEDDLIPLEEISNVETKRRILKELDKATPKAKVRRITEPEKIAIAKAKTVAQKTKRPAFVRKTNGTFSVTKNQPTQGEFIKVTPPVPGELAGKTERLRAKEKKPARTAKPKPPSIGQKPSAPPLKPLAKMFNMTMKTLEPAKITERAFGKDPGAIVIKGVHQADVGRIEFNEAEIANLDSTLDELGQKLSRYSDKILKNLMASRGKPVSPAAILTQKEALTGLIKDAPELVGMRKMITRIADMNYKYLQSVVGDDIKHVEDYFYGIYKDAKKTENFLDYWKTTKRFTKQKKLPTVADAIGYGLELRDYNPVNNLRAEYMAISRIDGMIYMRDELMRTGKGRYIDTKEDAPHDWEKIKEPVFKDVRVHPELAIMIKNLLATNKLRRSKFLRGLTHTNNALRTLKFAFSMFHHLNIIKQSIADEGYLKFLQPSATRGITFGFKKNDSIFKTPAYKDYIKHGGGHRYSIESQAERAFSQFVESLNKSSKKLIQAGALPLKIPSAYVKWMFQNYIPKVKYSKYLDAITTAENKTGKTPTSPEKIEILKEQQNFYGMMNERLFGRSGTVTALMRLWFMSPGYAEGNLRSELKSVLQWGGEGGHSANRSRSNIINSLVLSTIAATVGTLIMTGKPPKKPETLEDVRDLFKIDTGKVDDKGRRIMVDLLTYDKDYWDIIGQTLIGRPDKAALSAIKRAGGMVAPTADVILDIANMAAGRAIYDWKGDRVVEITDPFAQRVLKLAIHEIKRIEPISVSVYKQARKREQTKVLSAITALLGYRPTLTEQDKREQAVLHRIYSLRGQQEELYYHLSNIPQPRKAVANYNRTVDSILNSPMTPKAMKAKWEKKLIIDIDRMIENKAFSIGSSTRTDDQIKRDRRFLKNFKVTANDIEILIKRHKARPKTKTVISPLDRDPVIGLAMRKKRAKERFEKE